MFHKKIGQCVLDKNKLTALAESIFSRLEFHYARSCENFFIFLVHSTDSANLIAKYQIGTHREDISQGMKIQSYDDQLLHLSADLAQRLLPAFDTPTGSNFCVCIIHMLSSN